MKNIFRNCFIIKNEGNICWIWLYGMSHNIRYGVWEDSFYE